MLPQLVHVPMLSSVESVSLELHVQKENMYNVQQGISIHIKTNNMALQDPCSPYPFLWWQVHNQE